MYINNNHQPISRIESNDYKEEMPRWNYDVIDDDETGEVLKEEVEQSTLMCTLDELE